MLVVEHFLSCSWFSRLTCSRLSVSSSWLNLYYFYFSLGWAFLVLDWTCALSRTSLVLDWIVTRLCCEKEILFFRACLIKTLLGKTLGRKPELKKHSTSSRFSTVIFKWVMFCTVLDLIGHIPIKSKSDVFHFGLKSWESPWWSKINHDFLDYYYKLPHNYVSVIILI